MEVEQNPFADYFSCDRAALRENSHSSCSKMTEPTFFNPRFSINSLKVLLKSSPVRLSKSTSYKLKHPADFYVHLFGRDQCTQCESTEETVQTQPIALKSPPLKLAKRKIRNEHICKAEESKEIVGTVKCYSLKKRFGFLQTSAKDVFFCEDDLVISGIHLKQFKNDVYQKRTIRLAFKVQTYLEKGTAKEKACDIRLLNQDS